MGFHDMVQLLEKKYEKIVSLLNRGMLIAVALLNIYDGAFLGNS